MFWDIFIQSLALIIAFIVIGKMIAKAMTAKSTKRD